MRDAVFVVTNRELTTDRKTGEVSVGDEPNRAGPNELRLLAAEGGPGDWTLRAVPDSTNLARFHELGVEPITRKRAYLGSDLAAAIVLQRLQANDRNLVVFVHGYNNTLRDALDRAHRLAEAYGVEVVVFSWPANGGGQRFLEDVHGLASYKWDKHDARAATGAFDKLLARLGILLKDVNQARHEDLEAEARERFPDDRARQRDYLARLIRQRVCPFRVTLLTHSMGNYLFKKTLLASSERLSSDVIFDNVILKAADTNHADHDVWVERIRARHRVYVTINQDDRALMLSDAKLGDEQRPRLGNTLARQDAANATYLDATRLVGDAHSYFDAKDIDASGADAKPLTDFFARALNGEIAEEGLRYKAANNTYVLA
ncbi:MAG TPA: alpha/beta hydrolase [Gammaproteobacteria bacterium]|nr:alpha/beta hydrolase [Gammaproteobacteria bacterium]